MSITDDQVILEPSILSADFSRLGEAVRDAENAGVKAIQIDVMDGHFVPNIAFGPDVVRSLRDEVDLFLDVHLMITEPSRYLKIFSDSGADRLIVHLESKGDTASILRSIEKLGVKVGVAINPSTDLIRLENIVDIVDVVQIMTVNPGFGGQTFMRDQLDKIRNLKRKIDELKLSVRIAADGGINSETAPLAVQAGASILVAGSSIYNKESSVEENMKLLTESIMHEARVY
ncbi:MAG: ribulose-phosphate 3-epimerase [Thaumarchaeota archaeon]|nr:ribulose-phosphate 3-epimerase [Nitrososphaerota archaeon]